MSRVARLLRGGMAGSRDEAPICGRGAVTASKLFAGLSFDLRARRREWHSRDRLRSRRLWVAHVPLAHRKSAAWALAQIHVDMVLVIAVRARAKHRGEAAAGASSYAFTKVTWNMRIGQGHELAVREPQGADIERIGLAMFAELGADDIVAAAAIVRGVVAEAAQLRPEPVHGRNH